MADRVLKEVKMYQDEAYLYRRGEKKRFISVDVYKRDVKNTPFKVTVKINDKPGHLTPRETIIFFVRGERNQACLAGILKGLIHSMIDLDKRSNEYTLVFLLKDKVAYDQIVMWPPVTSDEERSVSSRHTVGYLSTIFGLKKHFKYCVFRDRTNKGNKGKEA